MPLKSPTTTPLPDEIYDVWAPQLGEAELKVLLYIVRRTLGFRKNADAISLSQFLHGIVTRDGRTLDRGCGVSSRPNVVRALKGLEDKGLIVATRARATAGDKDVTIYALRWEADEAGTAETEGGVATTPLGSVEKTPRWFRSDREVVSEEHYGGVAAKPTTNSPSTNRQQDSMPTGSASLSTSQRKPRSASPPLQPGEGGGPAQAGEIWRAVLDDLRATMTAANYDRWFAPTAGMWLDGDELTVTVPTDMHLQWLGVRLRHRVEATVRLLGYTDVRVVFAVAAGERSPGSSHGVSNLSR